MAAVSDVPDYLRPLASRVPAATRLNMSAVELRCRCEESLALAASADSADGEKAKRLRRESEKYLTAASLSVFLTEQGRLLDRIEQAKKVEGSREAVSLANELHKLDRDNPQPWERLSGALLEAANNELERRQAAVKRRWFRRGK